MFRKIAQVSFSLSFNPPGYAILHNQNKISLLHITSFTQKPFQPIFQNPDKLQASAIQLAYGNLLHNLIYKAI